MVGATHDHTPIEENASIYQNSAIFINLSRSLTENYEQIADFQRQHIAENKTQ